MYMSPVTSLVLALFVSSKNTIVEISMLVRTLNTYLLSNIDNTFSIERGLKSSSGRFHTRLFACKQPVADVQQARHFFSPCSLHKFYMHLFQ